MVLDLNKIGNGTFYMYLENKTWILARIISIFNLFLYQTNQFIHGKSVNIYANLENPTFFYNFFLGQQYIYKFSSDVSIFLFM